MKQNVPFAAKYIRIVLLLIALGSFFTAGYSENLPKESSRETHEKSVSGDFSVFQSFGRASLISPINHRESAVLNKISFFDELFGKIGENRNFPSGLDFLAPPSISSISPSTPQTSITDQNIVVNGSNFTNGLTVTVTFPSGGTGTLSGSQIVNVTSSKFTMKITLNATGTWRIRVNNPNGEQSGTFQFNVVAAQNPVINSISPSSPTVSNSDQNVNVSGSNFQDGMTVTVFFPGGGSGTLSGSQLQNITPTSFRMVVTLNLVGTYGIRVNNPSGRQSNTFQFQTQNPSPTISSISPSGVCAQNGDRSFSVSGSNFQNGLTITVFFPGGGSTNLSGSQIQYNSSSSFNMTATLNIVGTYNFRVNNPNGTSSSNFPYTTQNCNPNISSISPSTPTVSNSNQTVGVTGSNFQNGLTVTVFFPGGGSTTLSGSQIQFISSSSFNMIITLNIVGQYQIRVNNPNGTVSSNFSFNTQAAPPQIISISPSSPCVRDVDQPITINGSGFVNGLTLSITFPNGGTVTLSGTQIQNVNTFSITVLMTLANPGTYTIRVNNPGNVQSNSFTFTAQNCISVSGINPSSPTQSNVDQNITVNGNGFVSGLTVIVTLPDNTTVTLSGAQILNVTSTSFIMRITLNATGTWKIKVRNPNGDLSNIFSFTVQAPAPPVVTSINPSSPLASNVDQNVTVNGSNFQSGLTVTVTFPSGGTGTLSGTQIQNVTNNSFTMRITLGTAGSWSLRVNNPNGGQSSPFGFTVQSNTQSPSVFSINPATPVARSTDQDVIVTGNNFQPNLVVDITFPSGGGTTLSGTQIQNVTSTSFIMRATLNAVGSWTIKVRNPDGGQSGNFGFSVTGGTNPVINSINPAVPTMNGADQNVIVNGGNFQNGLRVNVTFPNGGVSTLQGTGQIQNVTANSFLMRITVNAIGTWNIRVINPDNSQSQQFAFNVQASGPPPTGLPTSILSPVIGPLRVTTSNQRINDGKWEFNQHKTGNHTPTGGISLSNDTFAWDINHYTPTSGNADAGKAVFAVADGQVVSYVGLQPGEGPGAVLIAHPNASNPIWFSGYLHMTNVRVNFSEFVSATTILGEIGSAGNDMDELHFVVYSGQNTRGNLQSFNAAITERLIGTTNAPTISTIDPPSTTQSDDLQLITINGTNFQSGSIIELESPDGRNLTITPETVSGIDAAKIEGITASTITARIPFAFAGNYNLTIVNRPNSSASPLSDNFVFPASSSSQYQVAPGVQKIPVVIIPGIMGSKLGRKQGNSYEEIFPSYPGSDKHQLLKYYIGYGNPISQRPIVATDIFRSYAYFFSIYGDLINTLTSSNYGYKEYKVSHPTQRTSSGCDFSLENDKANLYIFPYDWRSGNEQSAKDLKDYITCIGQRHGGINNPNFKVNIIAHSMGGLITRRYILEGMYGTTQYDPHVNKVVTLGTPWLGAPKFILALEEGDANREVNILLGKPLIKDILRYMQGAHELIPSRAYTDGLADVNPGDFPFGEDGWDYDGRNGIKPRYEFSELQYIMNRRQVANTDPPHTTILPGTNTDVFHNKRYLNNRPLQDDWSGDQTGVAYYNFVGRCLSNQGRYNTVGSVIAWRKPFYNLQNSTFVYKNVLEPKMQRGDCTVPEISGMRQSGRGNYLGPAQPVVFQNVEHGKFPNDPRVIQCIKFMFSGQPPSQCFVGLSGVSNPENANKIVDEPAYNLSVLGSPMVLISDSFGNTTSPLTTSVDEGVKTVSTIVTGEDFLHSIIPLDQNYKVTLKTSDSPLVITITKNQGDDTTMAIRYLDIAVPQNVLAQMEITPQGVSTLRYDSDGNGTFDTPVNPMITATGTDAQDVEPPKVIVNETAQNGTSQVVLEATDTGTGVRQIMYSLNGTTFQPYLNPLTLNPAQIPTLYVFADDNVFNRSGLTTHNLTASNAGFAVTGPSVATPGSQITANWNAPGGRPADDWIGLFRIGNLNSSYIAKQYTNGATSGSLNFAAPTQPGIYEFRYLLNDGFSSVAASGQIVVSGSRSPFDFDGDSKTDVSIFRPAPGEWWYLRSSDGVNRAVQFGSSTDKTVPADFTGDGKTDIAFWRESTGQWFVIRSEDSSFYAFPFGTNGDVPMPGDYDGDGKSDAAVFRPSNAVWYILRSSDNGVTIQQFGASEDRPVATDYDGDGKTDIAIFRPSVSEWWILKSGNSQVTALQFGQTGDKTVPGDFTGDGKADIAFYRPSTGFWYILRSEDNSFYAYPFGTTDDFPTPGDYDGDGKTDAAVFRPSNSTWYMQRSTSGFGAITFGVAGDQPLPNSYVR